MMAAFLNRQGGGAILARAIGKRPVPADAAKLALRAVYSLSQADPALVAALGKDAGISTEVKPLTAIRVVRAGRRGRRQGRPGPRRGRLPAQGPQLHDVPLRQQGRGRDRARPERPRPDIAAGLHHQFDPAPRSVDQGAIPYARRPDRRRPGLSGHRRRQGRPSRRAQGVHRSPADGAGRLDRGAEAGRLADAQGAGQPDDPRRVRGPRAVPLRAGQAGPLRDPDDADDPAMAGAQVGVLGTGRGRPGHRDPSRSGSSRSARPLDDGLRQGLRRAAPGRGGCGRRRGQGPLSPGRARRHDGRRRPDQPAIPRRDPVLGGRAGRAPRDPRIHDARGERATRHHRPR